MPEQLTFPVAFFKPTLKTPMLRGGTPQPRMYKSRRFLIALRPHGPGQPTGFFASHGVNALRGILGACLHGTGGGGCAARHARGGARALGGDVRLAWRGPSDRWARRPDG